MSLPTTRSTSYWARGRSLMWRSAVNTPREVARTGTRRIGASGELSAVRKRTSMPSGTDRSDRARIVPYTWIVSLCRYVVRSVPNSSHHESELGPYHDDDEPE